MSIVDEAVVWSKRSIDPWNRMTCCQAPVLTVIEFCQVQGPRPLYSYPANGGGPHLDLDSVAIWLMSSEAIHGSSMIVYNQQMAIYACVHHSTLLDLRARAFQRPISLALLTSIKPTTAMFKEFIAISRRLLLPLLICNRTLFKSHLIRLIDLTKTIDDDAPVEKNLFASISKSAITKIQSTAEQARRMLQRYQNDSLQSAMSNSIHCNGHQPNDSESDSEFLKQFGENYSPSLQKVEFLTPCAFDNFIEALPDAYEKITKTAKEHKTGMLFCAKTPVLKSKDRDNHYLGDDDDRNGAAKSVKFPDESDYLRNLTTVTESLDKFLFALLSGQKLSLWSVEDRKSLGEDLLKKLNLLRICMQMQIAPWKGEYENINEDEDYQLFGQSVPRKTSVTDSTDDALCVYDVDGRWLKCKNYKGKLLNFLSSKRSDSFPTDYSLIHYIVAQLTDFCSTVYLAKCRDLDRLRNRLQIEKDDIKMIVNLLAEIDILKYGALNEKMKKEGSNDLIVVKV